MALVLKLTQSGQQEALPSTLQRAQMGARPLHHNPNEKCSLDHYLLVFTKICIFYSISFFLLMPVIKISNGL